MDSTPNPRIGESFFIECTFNGIPIPQSVVWEKDGDEIDEIETNIKIVHTTYSSCLKIIQATSIDEGIYLCNISNIAGLTYEQIPIKLLKGEI